MTLNCYQLSSHDNVGNEVEIGNGNVEKSAVLGQYLSIDYLKSLEDKILKLTKVNYYKTLVPSPNPSPDQKNPYNLSPFPHTFYFQDEPLQIRTKNLFICHN